MVARANWRNDELYINRTLWYNAPSNATARDSLSTTSLLTFFSKSGHFMTSSLPLATQISYVENLRTLVVKLWLEPKGTVEHATKGSVTKSIITNSYVQFKYSTPTYYCTYLRTVLAAFVRTGKYILYSTADLTSWFFEAVCNRTVRQTPVWRPKTGGRQWRDKSLCHLWRSDNGQFYFQANNSPLSCYFLQSESAARACPTTTRKSR
jgi:hypothetical protein